MSKGCKRLLIKCALPLLGILLFLGVWWVAAAITAKEMLLPTPARVIREAVMLFREATFYTAIAHTLWRTLRAFVYAFVCALVFAVIAGASKPIAGLLSPQITIARAMPTMSIILLALVWLTSSTAPVLIGFLIAFPVLYSAFLQGITGIDSGLTEMCRVYRVSRINVIKQLYLPQLAPVIFATSASTLSMTLKIIIAGEVLAQSRNSIGVGMYIAKVQIETATLLGWTVVAVILGFLLELLVRGLQQLIIGRRAK